MLISEILINTKIQVRFNTDTCDIGHFKKIIVSEGTHCQVKSELKDKLKFLRKSERLTQQEIADLLECPLGTYKGWETRGKSMPAEMLTKLANIPKLEKYKILLISEIEKNEIETFFQNLEKQNITPRELALDLIHRSDDEEIEDIDRRIEQLMTFRRQLVQSSKK